MAFRMAPGSGFFAGLSLARSRVGASQFGRFVLSLEFRVPSSEFRVPSSEFRVQSSEFRVPSSEFRVQNSEFRVRVQRS
jgi:hypothetical protein